MRHSARGGQEGGGSLSKGKVYVMIHRGAQRCAQGHGSVASPHTLFSTARFDANVLFDYYRAEISMSRKSMSGTLLPDHRSAISGESESVHRKRSSVLGSSTLSSELLLEGAAEEEEHTRS